MLCCGAKHVEEVGGRLGHIDSLCLIGERQVYVSGFNRSEMFEDGVLRAPVDEVWSGNLDSLSFRIQLLDHHDAIGSAIRQTPQHHAIHNTEDGRARADTETERDHGDGRKHRALEQPAKCKPQIFQHGFHYSYLNATNGSTFV